LLCVFLTMAFEMPSRMLLEDVGLARATRSRIYDLQSLHHCISIFPPWRYLRYEVSMITKGGPVGIFRRKT
jgi:hypothetical protein